MFGINAQVNGVTASCTALKFDLLHCRQAHCEGPWLRCRSESIIEMAMTAGSSRGAKRIRSMRPQIAGAADGYRLRLAAAASGWPPVISTGRDADGRAV